MAYQYDFKIGMTYENMVNVESLADNTMPAPRTTFTQYSEMRLLADGSQRGIGAPTCEWNFGILKKAQRDALRAYCPGASTVVYIRTRTNDNDTYKNYQAIMNWPIFSENREMTGVRIDFIVTFRNLIEVI
ncbi:hypothetical protein C4588_04215 [Candidatus Parcubacteria bacterium]|jgi:hypothetical protein|nr:MAG: hypothetical protein C4588_04215 [Candidatus Parcubacteria bacterium]